MAQTTADFDAMVNKFLSDSMGSYDMDTFREWYRKRLWKEPPEEKSSETP